MLEKPGIDNQLLFTHANLIAQLEEEIDDYPENMCITWYAVTIHKCQGLSLDLYCAIEDLSDKVFSASMAYMWHCPG